MNVLPFGPRAARQGAAARGFVPVYHIPFCRKRQQKAPARGVQAAKTAANFVKSEKAPQPQPPCGAGSLHTSAQPQNPSAQLSSSPQVSSMALSEEPQAGNTVAKQRKDGSR